MSITVRHLRHGIAVRLTGAHARVFTGLLADLVSSRPQDAADRSDVTPAHPLEIDLAPVDELETSTGEVSR